MNHDATTLSTPGSSGPRPSLWRRCRRWVLPLLGLAVLGLLLSTNWLGYGLLAGGLFAAGAITPPRQAGIGADALRALGVAMILLAVAYVVACAFSRGRLKLPSAQLALVQLTLSMANWALMGCVMYLLLGRQVPYATTLSVLLAASIVGVITPIPAGLGVLEAVYLALLSGTVRQGALMGAVLAYRALYYLLPLGGGIVLYLLLERYAESHPQEAGSDTPWRAQTR